jgi:hypothetical protein
MLTGFFAFLYFLFSKTLPSHGLILTYSTSQVSVFDALYFSITTETTLGYGDIRPVGVSRLLACIQVLGGLLLAGLAVAKITSLEASELRLLAHCAAGDWIERNFMPDGSVIISLSTISIVGSVIRYDGENLEAKGEYLGFFRGELLDFEDSLLRFRWSNLESTTTHWTGGFANIQFTGDGKSDKWTRLTASAHDFGTKQITNYEGVRATEEESLIIRGTDNQARMQLVVKYATLPLPSPKIINATGERNHRGKKSHKIKGRQKRR